MNDYNPNPAPTNGGEGQGGGDNNQSNQAPQDGNNANHQGGDNSQGNEGGNQGGDNGGQNPNQNGDQGGNQAGDEDYKAKFGASTTENQKYREFLKKQGIDPDAVMRGEAVTPKASDQGGGEGNGAGDLPTFTDDQLEAAFPNFGNMSEQEKAVVRNVQNFPKVARMVAEMHDKLTFNEQLETLKGDPANKLIAENEQEFRKFAYEGENLKLPLEILTQAFIGKKLGANQGTGNQNGGNQNANNQQPRKGMEDGTAGQGSSGNGNGGQEYTPEAAAELRRKDPRKYNKLAAAGKLKITGS